MENKIFQKSISFGRVFYGFDPEIGLHFYFHFKPFPGPRRAKREREREREKRELPIHRSHPSTGAASTPASALPYISHHHWDRITIEDRSTQNRSHRPRRYPWPISSPMNHDRSLPFPQFLITLSSSLSQFDRIVEFNEWCCFDFCFFKFIYWNFLL